MPAFGSFVRFVAVGAAGFLIDAGLTQGFIASGLMPWSARAPAIVVAMAFTWQCNRRWTYGAAGKPGWLEAWRYLRVAGAVASLNYVMFLLLALAGVPPLVAIMAATALQTGIGFFAYRRFAFQATSL